MNSRKRVVVVASYLASEITQLDYYFKSNMLT